MVSYTIYHMIGKIVDKKEIATGTIQVSFKVSEPTNFKPGQYVFVTLLNPAFTDKKGNRRQFSLNNLPNPENILIITTRISESAFKKSLLKLPVGSEIEVGPIAGVFTLPAPIKSGLVFIAGGIGITPFLSMLGFIKEKKLPFNITLVYSNRNQESAAYLKQLQEYASTLINFKLILTMTDDLNWGGEKRMVSEEFIKDYFPNINGALYMVVGPPAMVDAVRKSLSLAGVNNENIQYENFTGY